MSSYVKLCQRILAGSMPSTSWACRPAPCTVRGAAVGATVWSGAVAAAVHDVTAAAAAAQRKMAADVGSIIECG